MLLDRLKDVSCPDCGVMVGTLHLPGCDLERCARCGLSPTGCECGEEASGAYPRLPWAGVMPGAQACWELGWFVRRVPGGRGKVPCGPDELGAVEDLDRFYREARWNPARGRWEAFRG